MKLLYKHTNSPICNLRIVIDAGSCAEHDPQDYGAAHFLEHMLFKGTDRRDCRQLKMELARYGDVNAYTNYEQTVFHYSFLASDFVKAAGILREMVLQPSLPADELSKEIGVIQEELKGREANPTAFFYHRFFEDLAAAHPIIGNRESIGGMTADRLRTFMARNYTRGRVGVVCVGDVEKDKVMDYAYGLDQFGLPAPVAVSPERFMSPALNFLPHSFHHTSKQAMLMLVWRGMPMQIAAEAWFVDDLAADVIGGGMESLLFQRIREQLGLCYSIWANSWCYARTGLFTVGCLLDKDKVEEATAEIKKVVEQALQKGVPDENFQVCQKRYLLHLMKGFEHSAGIAAIGDSMFAVTQATSEWQMDMEQRKKAAWSLTRVDVDKFAHNVLTGEPKLVVMTPES